MLATTFAEYAEAFDGATMDECLRTRFLVMESSVWYHKREIQSLVLKRPQFEVLTLDGIPPQLTEAPKISASLEHI